MVINLNMHKPIMIVYDSKSTIVLKYFSYANTVSIMTCNDCVSDQGVLMQTNFTIWQKEAWPE